MRDFINSLPRYWHKRLAFLGLLLITCLIVIENITIYRALDQNSKLSALIVSIIVVGIGGIFAVIAISDAHNLRDAMATDEKTGVLTQAEFERFVVQADARANRSKESYCLLFVDINNFKKGINGKYGHDFGDIVLRNVAGALNDTIRPNQDYVCRRGSGADEFIVLLANTDEAGAQAVVDKLHRAVAQIEFTQVPGLTVSISIGVSVCNPETEDQRIQRMLEEANKRMFENKREHYKRESRTARERAKQGAGAPSEERSGGFFSIFSR